MTGESAWTTVSSTEVPYLKDKSDVSDIRKRAGQFITTTLMVLSDEALNNRSLIVHILQTGPCEWAKEWVWSEIVTTPTHTANTPYARQKFPDI